MASNSSTSVQEKKFATKEELSNKHKIHELENLTESDKFPTYSFFDYQTGRYGTTNQQSTSLYQGLTTYSFARNLFGDKSYTPLAEKYPNLLQRAAPILSAIESVSMADGRNMPVYSGKRKMTIAQIRGGLFHNVENCFKLEGLFLFFYDRFDRKVIQENFNVAKWVVPCDCGTFGDHLLLVWHKRSKLDALREFVGAATVGSIEKVLNFILTRIVSKFPAIALRCEEYQAGNYATNYLLKSRLSTTAFKISRLTQTKEGEAHCNETIRRIFDDNYYTPILTDDAITREDRQFIIFKKWKKVSYLGEVVVMVMEDNPEEASRIVNDLISFLESQTAGEEFISQPVQRTFKVKDTEAPVEEAMKKRRKNQWDIARNKLTLRGLIQFIEDHIGRLEIEYEAAPAFVVHSILRSIKFHENINTIDDQSQWLNDLRARYNFIDKLPSKIQEGLKAIPPPTAQ
jgi:hypothetical protein